MASCHQYFRLFVGFIEEYREIAMRWMSWVKVAVGAALGAAGLTGIPAALEACTRCVYLGPKDTVVVARSMDWVEDPGTNLYAFPRGMKRNGESGRDPWNGPASLAAWSALSTGLPALTA